MASLSIAAHPTRRLPQVDERSQFEREVRMHLQLMLLRPMTPDERQLLAAGLAARK